MSLGWETTLLQAALGAVAVSFVLQAAQFFRADNKGDRAPRRLLLIGVGLLTVSLALLTAYFLATSLRIEYVFSYTRSGYPWYYKLAGLWGGQKGTLLMWAAFTGIVTLLADRHTSRAIQDGRLPKDADAARRGITFVLTGLLTVFAILTLVAKTFELTSPYLLAFRPNGNGLQPVLLTRFMVIHPPLQFVAYALTALLFAGGVVNVATGNRHWADMIRPWARLTWLILTLGLGLGGLWAYYVLNFGGFWAWDPVETANLLVWFPVTLLLHALLRYREGRFSLAAPLFALLTLPMSFFSTVATRTGLWVSVHAFTDPSKNFARDPLVRLLNILETGALIRFLTAFFLATLLTAFVALAFGRVRHWPEPRRLRARFVVTGCALFVGLLLFLDPVALISLIFQAGYVITAGRSAALGLAVLCGGIAMAAVFTSNTPEPHSATHPRTRGSWVDRWTTAPNVFMAGVVFLSLAFVIVFLLDVLSVNGYNRLVYDDRAPIVAPFVFATMGCLFLLPAIGAKRAAGLASGTILLGATLAFLFREHWELLLVLPSLGVAFGAALHKSLRYARDGAHLSRRERWTSNLLVLAGLVGLVFWANPPTHIQLGFTELHLDWGWAILGYLSSMTAVLCGWMIRARPDARWSRLGALCLLPAFGYGVSAVAGVAALFLRAGTSVGSRPFWQSVRGHSRAFQRATIYFLHASLVLGMIGFAAATYESRESELVRADQSTSDTFEGYTFRVLDSRPVGIHADDGTAEEVHARLQVLRDGQPVEEADLVFWHVHDNKVGHYDARVTVFRQYGEDLYLYPRTLHTSQGPMADHGENLRPTGFDVQAVELTVKRLPAMNLVWSGLWLVTLAMAANLALGGFAINQPASTPSPSSLPRHGPAPTVAHPNAEAFPK